MLSAVIYAQLPLGRKLCCLCISTAVLLSVVKLDADPAILRSSSALFAAVVQPIPSAFYGLVCFACVNAWDFESEERGFSDTQAHTHTQRWTRLEVTSICWTFLETCPLLIEATTRRIPRSNRMLQQAPIYALREKDGQLLVGEAAQEPLFSIGRRHANCGFKVFERVSCWWHMHCASPHFQLPFHRNRESC